METTTNNNTQEPIKLINLAIRFKSTFFQLWPLVLVLTLGASLFSYIQAKRSFTPMYEASAIFTVDSSYVDNDIFSTGAYYDQYAAEQLATAFPQILSTEMMRDLVLQELDQGYINGYAYAEAVAESNLLVLRVQSAVPEDAYEYLCAILDCYPQVAVYMMDQIKVRIMQAPTVPDEPYNVFDGSYSAMRGGVIGFVAGLAILLACALLTRTIQTTDELKSALNLPILVALPKVVQKKRRKNVSAGLITAKSDPNMAESLRGLRVKIKKLLDSPEKKTVLVTSTLAGEGKTTVAINLARSLTSDGHKVLLLDADLRNQSVARALGDKAAGYSLLDCLKDPDISILDLIRKSESMNFDYISGRNTDQRHYSINAKALEQILEVLTMQYDYVIMDTPPCEVVSDTATLCRCADCVLYVVRQDYAQNSQVLNAITSLHQKDVTIAGCIFNGVPQFHRQYGYGYRSSYGYGYDYGYRKYSYGSKYGYGYSKYAKEDKSE